MNNQPSQPQPIQTRFKGVLYRSRQEARWALFMDMLSVPFQYEPDAFKIGDLGVYLPDFYLHLQDCYLEIKGAFPSELEMKKAQGLAQLTGKYVFLLFGPVEIPTPEKSQSALRFSVDGWDDCYWWRECPACHRTELHWLSDTWPCECGQNWVYDSDRLEKAYELAFGFRFDEWQ